MYSVSHLRSQYLADRQFIKTEGGLCATFFYLSGGLIMEEKILATQDIFKGRIVNLKVHDVDLPNGQQSKREIIYHQGAVAIVALDEAYNVLLVKQFRLAAGQVTLEIPAGLLEPDEDPLAAVGRELQEETGYRPLNLQSLGGVYVAPGYTTEYIHLYYATAYEYAPLQQDDDEFVESVKMPMTQALQLIETGEIIEAKTIVALLRVARYLQL